MHWYLVGRGLIKLWGTVVVQTEVNLALTSHTFSFVVGPRKAIASMQKILLSAECRDTRHTRARSNWKVYP